ncbi:MAG: antibiotic biosynthesis monooxygenase [Patescibacteria group bacterium]|jgi:heme-degrading monooxygenase HmoA
MFVAINRMGVPEGMRATFEQHFMTRAGAVDRRQGFIKAEVLRPKSGSDYLVMTHWQSEADFNAWVGSPEFHEGHRRMADFKDSDGKVTLTSSMETYDVFAG